MNIVKIGLTSDEYKAHVAEEASWNDNKGQPSGIVEVRFADGETDRGHVSHWEWQDESAVNYVVQWRRK